MNNRRRIRSRSRSPMSVSGGDESDRSNKKEKEKRAKIPKSIRKKVRDLDIFMRYYMKKHNVEFETMEKVAGITRIEFLRMLAAIEFRENREEYTSYPAAFSKIREKFSTEQAIKDEMKERGYNLYDPKVKTNVTPST